MATVTRTISCARCIGHGCWSNSVRHTLTAQARWLRVATRGSLEEQEAAAARVQATLSAGRGDASSASNDSKFHRSTEGREDGPQSRKRVHPNRRTKADFVLGLSVRRHMAGYALMRFDDLLPLQFGLIDVGKALEVQQKGLEIAAVLRDLRKIAPDKLTQALLDSSADTPDEADQEDVDDEDWQPATPSKPSLESKSHDTSSKSWRWLVSVDDSTVDRAAPNTAAQVASQSAIAMLQGLVIADCKRLFKVAPVLVHPRRSRQALNVQGRGVEARKKVHDLAGEKVDDFPAVRYEKTNAIKEDSYLMSDAWASARYAQRFALVTGLKEDADLVQELRKDILGSKKFLRMRETVEELLPRKAGRELEAVIEKQAESLVENQLHRLLDEEERKKKMFYEKRSPVQRPSKKEQ